MSRAVKTIASIALPIAGSIFLPGIGTALGIAGLTTAAGSATALGAGLGGAIGGAAGGAVKGGGIGNIATGAALGGAGGYFANGGLTDLGITGPGSILGEAGTAGGETVSPAVAAADAAATPAGAASSLGAGSGILGTATSYLPSSILSGGGSLVGGGASSLLTPAAILGGNAISGVLGANAANKASQLQYKSTQDALAQQKELTAPYVNAGTTALGSYQDLLSNPKAQTDFIQNNPFYSSLADDAKRRLLATQASSGKIASGGTANALQTQLLNLGNGLLQGQLGNLQNTINTGANAATGTATNNSNLITQGGTAQSAGTIGSYNAGNGAYQNTINSLLALQKLKQPNVNVYAPANNGNPYSLNA